LETILVVCDQKPFPVRDGISAALASASKSFSSAFNLDYYLLSEQKLYSGNQNFVSDAEPIPLEQVLKNYRIVLASPLNTVYRIAQLMGSEQYLIALLSDCYSYVLYRNWYVSRRINYFSVQDYSKLARIPLFFYKERAVARKAQLILLQTDTDCRVFTQLFGNKAKVYALPNSVQQEHKQENTVAETQKLRTDTAFVASFDGSYTKVAHWFVREVWRKVLAQKPNARLHLLGVNSTELRDWAAQYFPETENSLISVPYQADIGAFYSDKNIVVSPIFKGYGLINKTVEALKNGCIVIGDATAFNGLKGFKEGVNAFAAENSATFAARILENLEKPNTAMRSQAQNLIQEFELERAALEKKVIEKINSDLNK
jgi:hypothetical protein